MINRDGSHSNGYFASSDHVDDMMIEDNGHMADAISRDIGLWCYVTHRIQSNFKTIYRRVRRWYQTKGAA